MKLHKITRQDDIREEFQHIFIDKDNIVATNAHILVIVPKTLFFEGQEIPEMFVRGRDWAKIYPRKNHFVKYEENHLVLYSEAKLYRGEVARVKPILKENAGFKYPDYTKVIPNGELKEVDKIGINSYFMRLYNKATGINEIKLSFYGHGKPIVIKPFDDYYQDVKAVIMPIVLPEWIYV